MPIRAGTATPTFRLGTSAVSRMYLGTALVYSTGTTPPPSSGVPTPYAVSATATTSGSIIVQWRSAPGSTGYQLQFSTNNGAQWQDAALTATTTTAGGIVTGTATLAAPTSGARYVFKVAGTTSNGISAYSQPSNGAAIYDKPSTPTGLTATVATGGNIVLAWTASTGNGPIYYWPEYSSDGGTTYRLLPDVGATEAGGGERTFYTVRPTMEGIAPGVSYRFRVFAGTKSASPPTPGDSIWGPNSDPSTATGAITMPTGVPGPVNAMNVRVGAALVFYERFRTSVTAQTTGGAIVRFSDPPRTGGSAITEYRIYDRTASPLTPYLTIPVATAGQYTRTAVGVYRSATVEWSDIVGASSRSLRVTAVNSVGEGEAWDIVVPGLSAGDYPFRITGLTATPLAAGAKFVYPGGATYDYSSGARAVSLSWSAPDLTVSGLSGNPQKPYFQIQVQSLAASTQSTESENWTEMSLSGRPYSQSGNTIDFLSPSTPYVARVRATYVSGVYGPYSYVTFTTAS